MPAGTDMMIPVTEHDLQSALIVGRILAYAQGFEILAAGSKEFNWSLDFARIAEIWRAGCIIRSAMLDDIATAFRSPLPAGIWRCLTISSPCSLLISPGCAGWFLPQRSKGCRRLHWLRL